MSIISAQNINKTFNAKKNSTNISEKKIQENQVLKNISLEVETGKITSLMGASGVGKSTLLYILGTLENPDSGKIHLNIKDKSFEFSKLSQKELSVIRSKHIGFVFQFHHLLPEFSTLENIMMPALILGISQKDAEKKALELMEIIKIEKTKNQKPAELSGGEQQRAAIARALINSPEIIFADEPTGNLDSKNANIVFDLIKNINSEMKITFLLATHSNEIASQSDRIIKMQDGKII
jgi:lipoprotein-releasing system ATP-binding protein